jgi:hypothetical protein
MYDFSTHEQGSMLRAEEVHAVQDQLRNHRIIHTHFVVVKTCGAPDLLRRNLASLSSSSLDPDVTLIRIVIDDSTNPTDIAYNRTIASDFEAFYFSVHAQNSFYEMILRQFSDVYLADGIRYFSTTPHARPGGVAGAHNLGILSIVHVAWMLGIPLDDKVIFTFNDDDIVYTNIENGKFVPTEMFHEMYAWARDPEVEVMNGHYDGHSGIPTNLIYRTIRDINRLKSSSKETCFQLVSQGDYLGLENLSGNNLDDKLLQETYISLALRAPLLGLIEERKESITVSYDLALTTTLGNFSFVGFETLKKFPIPTGMSIVDVSLSNFIADEFGYRPRKARFVSSLTHIRQPKPDSASAFSSAGNFYHILHNSSYRVSLQNMLMKHILKIDRFTHPEYVSMRSQAFEKGAFSFIQSIIQECDIWDPFQKRIYDAAYKSLSHSYSSDEDFVGNACDYFSYRILWPEILEEIYMQKNHFLPSIQ